MASASVPRKVLATLARQVRDNPAALGSLQFADATTSVSNVVTTTDLRIDVHKNSKDSRRATGIVQANSGAKDKSVKAFIRGRTGGHQGTHQVIKKISFYLGDHFDANAFADKIEDEGVGKAAVASASSSRTVGDEIKQSEWTWSKDKNHYYRQGAEGWLPWAAPAVVEEWTWSVELKDHYTYVNGKYSFGAAAKR
jgi:hypothetical protein